MKLDDVYKEWIHVKARQVKLSSLSTYQLIYLRKLAPAFGDMEIEQLNKKIIVPFLLSVDCYVGLANVRK